MGRRYTSSQAGLSTVELLITLFVAGLFLTAGYTLYAFVLKDSGATRADARATAVANEYLELYRPVSDSCSPDTPTIDPQPTVEGLTNVSVTVVISCPDSDNPSISKIEVTVDADNLQNPVKAGGYEGPEAPGPDEYNIGSSFPNYSTPTTPVFYWTAISGADSYGIRYKVNGGSWTSASDVVGGSNTTYTYGGAEVFRDDTVTIEVTAKQGGNPMAASGYGTATIPKWTVCPMQNGWTAYHPSWSEAEFTKTSAGVVMMRGMIKAGTITSGTVICTLPAGFRPDNGTLIFFTATAGTTAGRLDVETDGDILYRVGHSSWESLSAITFATGGSGWQTPTASNGWVDYDAAGGYSDVRYKVDTPGRVQLQGLARSGSYTGYTTVAYTLPGAYIPSANDIHPSYPCASTGSFYYSTSATIVPRNLPGNSCWSLQAILYPSSYTGDGGWQYPTPPAGWQNYGGGYASAGYIKSSDDIVSLRGLVVNASNGETLFTLPTGYRPSKTILCYVVSNPETFARVDVGADGTVISREGTNAGWLSLAGCNFIAEQ